MGQLGASLLQEGAMLPLTENAQGIAIPTHIPPIPIRRDTLDAYYPTVSEVWCGSEFTVIADQMGVLYGSGWNDHGNLTSRKVPMAPGNIYTWTPITAVGGRPVAIPGMYEGYVACGGSHCIAVTREN